MTVITPQDDVRMPSPDEVTADFRSNGASVDVQPERIQVALDAPPAGLGATEVQILLRNRLCFVGLVASAIFGCGLCLQLVTVAQNPAVFALSWRRPTSFCAVFMVVALLTAILWSRLPLSLGRLRLIECLLFGLPLAHVTWHFVDVVWLQSSLMRAFQARPASVADLIDIMSLYYFVLIAGYGTLIPNTGCRCGLMVAIMASLPLALVIGVGAAEGVLWAEHRAAFLKSLVVLTLWMVVASALAIYGCHRIDVLRSEVLATRQLGQYRLRQRLGSGGMGQVYLAEHVLLRRQCALKLIRPERAGDPKNLRRFEREVKLTATLTHPNTIQIFDYGHADDGTFYYVMEFLAGLTLEELVKAQGPLHPARVIHFLRQVCGALREAHGRGLIHRDIKPSNVMICERGGIHDVAKLLDFGLVLPAGDDGEKLTQDGAITGTPAYLSPEQAGGQETVDARSDIYSVGALAYFLLTEGPPFANRTSVKMLAAHLYETPEPLSRRRADVPADLEAVILRCLAKEPQTRFPDAESLDLALAACLVASQ